MYQKWHIYIINIIPIYHKNQGHIPVIWIRKNSEQARTELRQAQIKLKLGFTLIKI